MTKYLLGLNLLLAAVLGVVLLTHGQTSAGSREPAGGGENQPAGLSPERLKRSGDSDTIDRVKQRITEDLRAKYFAKYMAGFEHPKPMECMMLGDLKDSVYHNYSGLLRGFGLCFAKTERLAELLARRSVSSRYFTNVPPELIKEGIPADFSFGTREVEDAISQEFGGEVLAKVKDHDGKLPVLKQRSEILEIISATGESISSEAISRIDQAIRDNPARAGSLEERRIRSANLAKAISLSVGNSSAAIFEKYMRAREDSIAALDALKKLRRGAEGSQETRP